MSSRRNSKTMSWLPSRTKRNPLLVIQIDGHFQSKIYTSGSTVSGCVTISAQSYVPYQAVQVVLRGMTSTSSHALQYSDPLTTHTFLKINMPVSETFLPVTRILEAGQSYRIPFIFVIPHQLSSTACQHRSMAVWERHLQLPPTMGSWEYDDLAGDSVQVEYAVIARLVLPKDKDGKDRYLENTHSLKVIPQLPEHPPLHVSPSNAGYCLSRSKTIRKNLVGTKMGWVIASAAQPNPIALCHDKLQSSESQILVHLAFTPTSNSHTPPDIRVKSATIDIFTDYWLGSTGYLPDQHDLLNKPAPKAPWLTSRTLVLGKTEHFDLDGFKLNFSQ
ncbi:hypothetical protein FSARC_12637 [Fusarium sarcochroum]|uniref:Arrestin-like N-terminal domain-containing protein n=1 Tax=Fusarium sarcochroum TaxID=1208366 RepID=A0A8H4WW08_9HYPO|nr:hypothetical protein FSARC_12637 [Fusarium sarcochroum]